MTKAYAVSFIIFLRILSLFVLLLAVQLMKLKIKEEKL